MNDAGSAGDGAVKYDLPMNDAVRKSPKRSGITAENEVRIASCGELLERLGTFAATSAESQAAVEP